MSCDKSHSTVNGLQRERPSCVQLIKTESLHAADAMIPRKAAPRAGGLTSTHTELNRYEQMSQTHNTARNVL